MKTIRYTLFFSLAMMAMFSLHAQQVNPYPKTIQVSGSAEMKIIPDQIYVQVILKEYEKKGQGKVNIEAIRNNFLKQYKAIGMPDSLISIAGYDGQSNDWIWRKKKRKDELYASLTYQIRFSNSKQMDELVNRLDDDATQSFQVVSTTHSRLEQFKKELKIEAVKAAKEKANYLAKAIDEEVGAAITIDEPHEYFQPYARVSNKMMEASMADGAEALPDVDFMKIKLKYDVRVVFALK